MKELKWIGSSKADLLELPDRVRNEVGHALYLVQLGRKPRNAKPMLGFGGASVLEIVEDYDSDTFRVVYAVKFEEAIYVLHCFQKKSTQGIKTPKREIEIVEQRLRVAEESHRKWLESQRPEDRRRTTKKPRK